MDQIGSEFDRIKIRTHQQLKFNVTITSCFWVPIFGKTPTHRIADRAEHGEENARATV